MKKKYISMGASPLSVDIQTGDTLRSFDFYGGMKSPVVKLPVYSTSDETEQEILESYPGFNVSFRLSDETINAIGEVKKPEKTGELKSFKTLGEAKAWINETHEIPFHKLTNAANISAEFEKLNYALEIENTKNK